MAPPQMDSAAEVVDPPTARRPLSPATPVHMARVHLRDSGGTAAVVFRSGEPVGVVTAAALDRAFIAGRANDPVVAVMDYVTVAVVPHADAAETVGTFIRAARDWLVRRPAA